MKLLRRILHLGAGLGLPRASLALVIFGGALAFLTPFVVFPEIMGDHGVTEAGQVRNALAITGIALGMMALFAGSLMVAFGVVRRFARIRRSALPHGAATGA